MLLLAGALCTAAFFEDLMAEPELTGASVRLVAATLPGFGDTSPPDDLSMESYASLAGRLAADVGCEAVLGHSVGANVAIEMAAAGEFSGPLALLSPSFSREDESKSCASERGHDVAAHDRDGRAASVRQRTIAATR